MRKICHFIALDYMCFPVSFPLWFLCQARRNLCLKIRYIPMTIQILVYKTKLLFDDPVRFVLLLFVCTARDTTIMHHTALIYLPCSRFIR